MGKLLKQDERHALDLIYGLMFDKLKSLYGSVDARRKRAVIGVKEDMLSDIYTIRDIQDLSEMVHLISQGRDSGVCLECDGVFDHEEGCEVDRAENPGFAW